MIDEKDRAALEALYDWYRAAGATLDVGDAPTDWFARSIAPAERPAERDVPGADAPRDPAARRLPTARAGGQSQDRGRPLAPTEASSGAPMPRARAGSPAAANRAGSASSQRPTPTPDADADLDALQATIAAAYTLRDLDAILADGYPCSLRKAAKQHCFFRGAETADLMVIGEAPGREEDMRGQPFVGPAGQLLDRMLAAIGIDEAAAHITNIVYWRPPGNRNPSPEEVASCAPVLARQIALVRPRVLLLLGRPAANTMLASTEPMKRLRGRWRSWPSAEPAAGQMAPSGGPAQPIDAIATFHPAYLLRTPSAKRDAWVDLLAVRDRLDGRA